MQRDAAQLSAVFQPMRQWNPHTGTCRFFVVGRQSWLGNFGLFHGLGVGRFWGWASWTIDNWIDKALVVLFPKVQLESC
jgi:hypothetical protein